MYVYNHACTDPSCVFCRQSANGNLNVEGIAMYYVQENTIATTMNVQLLFTVFHQNTWPNFLSSMGPPGEEDSRYHHPLNPDHLILVAEV